MIANQYPIGDFSRAESYSKEELDAFLNALKTFPDDLDLVLWDISDEQLNTAYREGGWTARQVVHHLADSHMNMLVRLKWTLTEDTPKIKAYYEDRWANLPDYSLPISVSVSMLKGIHVKIVQILENLSDEELNRKYFHPESQKYWDLKTVMALYAWHGKHHLAHIKICKGEWKA
ncbi:putative metal-dependent hydrolase [Marinilongibacter aquaticus]|uniref:YfiT family bacillithiol transferase n=1 Tax=Marinilongibacter aquaticus TaxID=2975157 RepID=UPI0021BD37DD|nr:putative metal-dependent hydrolase [Marinilongibacter aquaticus]UBM59404.1 putative metal-dependent hydrolase [Marinilongibacter aquaticus]